jgi:hypothetical protein
VIADAGEPVRVHLGAAHESEPRPMGITASVHCLRVVLDNDAGQGFLGEPVSLAIDYPVGMTASVIYKDRVHIAQ